MRQPRRSTAAALLLSASLLLATSACTSGGADEAREPAPAPAVTGIGADDSGWPRAIDPADAEATFWVVWTDIVDNGDGAAQQLEPTIAKLGADGYQLLPWDPACQTGAEEQLAGLTGYADPIGVGVAFASAQDAGVFDNLYDGTTISITQGTYTCSASS